MTDGETRGRVATFSFFFFRMPRTPQEYIVSIDLSNTWRQHLGKFASVLSAQLRGLKNADPPLTETMQMYSQVWSKKNGDDLKRIVTERFGSSTVFLSLLFSSEMGLIYSPVSETFMSCENLAWSSGDCSIATALLCLFLLKVRSRQGNSVCACEQAVFYCRLLGWRSYLFCGKI